MLQNSQGRVLLVKSPRRGWEFPGGQVEVGESLPEALMREIQEESGVIAKIVGIIGIYSNTSPRVFDNGELCPSIVNIDFRCEYISGELQTSEESIDVGWFSVEEAKGLVVHPKLAYRFENMINDSNNFHCYAFKEPFEFTEKYEF